jgi:hypothetical protein
VSSRPSDTAIDECAPEVLAADPGTPLDEHDHTARLAYLDTLELADVEQHESPDPQSAHQLLHRFERRWRPKRQVP